MATVRMPNSWAVRKTRMAISLRLATRGLRIGLTAAMMAPSPGVPWAVLGPQLLPFRFPVPASFATLDGFLDLLGQLFQELNVMQELRFLAVELCFLPQPLEELCRFFVGNREGSQVNFFSAQEGG